MQFWEYYTIIDHDLTNNDVIIQATPKIKLCKTVKTINKGEMKTERIANFDHLNQNERHVCENIGHDFQISVVNEQSTIIECAKTQAQSKIEFGDLESGTLRL